MMAVGDIMFERKVKGLQLKRDGPIPLSRWLPPLRGRPGFRQLGVPWGWRPVSQHVPREPESVWGLAYGGVDVVSLANNHILDYDNQFSSRLWISSARRGSALPALAGT